MSELYDRIVPIKAIDGTGSTKGLTAIILTHNEAIHIERCVRSVQRVAAEVLVVDSFSTDDTVIVARGMGARVLQNPWTNHANQINWALQNGNIRTEWVMRLDADEVIDDRLALSLRSTLEAAPSDVSGFEINRRIRFMGRVIRHGGMAPLWVTRLWRNGCARCEVRWMDEHMVLSGGRGARLLGSIIDENLNSLTWWTQKHNLYANREAVDLLDRRFGLGITDRATSGLNRQAHLKRWLKTYVYARLPLGLRPWLYFFYRICLRLGFLDGARGMLFHALQGLWYRLLVDAKVAEVERVMDEGGCELREAIRRILDIDLDEAPAPDRRQEEA